jgi:hypothetical protein
MGRSILLIATFAIVGLSLANCGYGVQEPAEEGPQSKVKILTDRTFDKGVATGLVLVEFWSPW